MPVNSGKDRKILQLRAHHICCLRFSRTAFEERGPDFLRAENKIKSILLSQSEAVVMVIEGVDDLCRQCLFCINERCNSPQGNEEAVRKWDAILLGELGLPFGTCLTAGEWQALIEPKTPFQLCQKCQWQPECNMEDLL